MFVGEGNDVSVYNLCALLLLPLLSLGFKNRRGVWCSSVVLRDGFVAFVWVLLETLLWLG